MRYSNGIIVLFVTIVALIGLLSSPPPSPTAYAICAQGELVELGITSQGGPYRACGPIRAVNHTSTYRQLR